MGNISLLLSRVSDFRSFITKYTELHAHVYTDQRNLKDKIKKSFSFLS